MKSRVVLQRKKSITMLVALVLASIAVASLVAVLVITSPVYSVAEVRNGLLSTPRVWLGRTVRIRALDIYPGGGVAWLIDPKGRPGPYAQGLPITSEQGLPVTPGQWQTPTFPRSLIWWVSSNVSALRGIDGGRVEVYRITLTKPLQNGCLTCSVGHG